MGGENGKMSRNELRDYKSLHRQIYVEKRFIDESQ